MRVWCVSLPYVRSLWLRESVLCLAYYFELDEETNHFIWVNGPFQMSWICRRHCWPTSPEKYSRSQIIWISKIFLSWCKFSQYCCCWFEYLENISIYYLSPLAPCFRIKRSYILYSVPSINIPYFYQRGHEALWILCFVLLPHVECSFAFVLLTLEYCWYTVALLVQWTTEHGPHALFFRLCCVIVKYVHPKILLSQKTCAFHVIYLLLGPQEILIHSLLQIKNIDLCRKPEEEIHVRTTRGR